MRYIIVILLLLNYNHRLQSQDSLYFDDEIEINRPKSDDYEVSFEDYHFIFYFNKKQVIERLKYYKNAESDLIRIILDSCHDSIRFSVITDAEIPVDDSIWRYGTYFDNVMPYLLQFIGFKLYELESNSFLQFQSLSYREYSSKRGNCEGQIRDFRIYNDKVIYEDARKFGCKEVFKLPLIIGTDGVEDSIFDIDNIVKNKSYLESRIEEEFKKEKEEYEKR